MHMGVFRCVCHRGADGYIMKTRDRRKCNRQSCAVCDGSYPEVMDGCKQNCLQEFASLHRASMIIKHFIIQLMHNI